METRIGGPLQSEPHPVRGGRARHATGCGSSKVGVRSILAAAAIVVVGITGLPSPPAAASKFGATDRCGYQQGTSGAGTGCLSLQNNRWFAGRPATFGNQWPGIDSAVRDSLRWDYDPTDLRAYWTTSDPRPDVWFWDWTWTTRPNAAAWVDCPASNTGVGYYDPATPSTRWCRGQVIRFNWTGVLNLVAEGLVDISPGGTEPGLPLADFSDYIACHELGRTLGLRHNGNPWTCTNYEYSGLDLPGYDDGFAPFSNAHDRSHIDARY